jgi:glycosidase
MQSRLPGTCRATRRTIVLALLVALASPAATDAPDRVEPPFWWQGFEHRELQLLVHAPGIAEFDVAVDRNGINLDRVARVDSDNYLFLYLDIDASAKPGKFDIVFENQDSRLTHEYELRKRNADPAYAQGFGPADTIYLITPDRFVNGDPSNDSIPGLDDKLNRDDEFGRHGGDLAGIESSLDYIADMGFTAVWLNPVLENAMPRSSYHGYATTDFYKVDPRLGSNEQYRELVAAARSKGLGVIMDMIVNHAGIGHWWMDDLPTSDWLNLPDTRSRTSHARTTNQDPYASAYDKSAHADGWFSDRMPDLNQRNALLADYLTQNAIWWIEYLQLNGIRMDTHPYPDKHYLSEWSRRVMQEYPGLNLVGEEWSINPAIVSYWQRGKTNHDGYVSSMPGMLDFPLQNALREALTAPEQGRGSVWTPVYEMLGNDFLYPDPANLVVFPDNHDMSRIYTQVNEDYDLFRMAMAYYLTMRGIPQIYYGTEVLLSHAGTESHGAIREEFPGGWPDHKKNAFTGEGLNDQERQAQEFMRTLLAWRKEKSVIHNGRLMQFTPIGSVYAYFRYDDLETVMVVFNRGDEAAALDMARFTERLGDSDYAEDVITGKRFGIRRSMRLEPRSVMILEIQ